MVIYNLRKINSKLTKKHMKNINKIQKAIKFAIKTHEVYQKQKNNMMEKALIEFEGNTYWLDIEDMSKAEVEIKEDGKFRDVLKNEID